jgi:short-subunit dehydrogenase
VSNQKTTIAIIGAGPGVGFAVAARFAREGFAVALLARDRAKLDALVARLATEYDVPVQAYAVDALDRALLVDTLGRVESELGPIDAIEFSPTVAPDTLRSPQDISVDNERYHLDLQPPARGRRTPRRA